MKRICIILFTALLATQAWAEATFEVGNLKFTVIEGTTNVSVSKGSTKPSGALNIPEKVTNPNNSVKYTVTSIGDGAFSWCVDLTSVTIPNSVKSIGDDAFEQCNGLEKAEFASIESLCSIDFVDYTANPLCYAQHLYITGEENEVTDLSIPNSVTSIGNYAFYYCYGLISVIIGNSVSSIGKAAFAGCNYLSSVTIGNSVKTIGGSAFLYCSGLKLVSIGNSVESIGDRAFQGCSGLTSVTIPNSVTSIGKSAFNSCHGLATVTIPNSVTSIGESAFNNCSGLATVTIPNSVTSIGSWAFFDCRNATLYCEDESSQKHYEWDSNFFLNVGDVKMSCQVIRAAVNDESFGSVTANDENAAVKSDDATLWYLSGNTNISATLTAEPAEGCHFVRWEDDAEAGATRVVNAALSQPYKAVFAKDEPTAISTMEQNSLAVSAVGRNILVKNATGEVLVYDTTGRLVARQMPQQQNVISAESRGLYIVKSGNDVVRVIVND